MTFEQVLGLLHKAGGHDDDVNNGSLFFTEGDDGINTVVLPEAAKAYIKTEVLSAAGLHVATYKRKHPGARDITTKEMQVQVEAILDELFNSSDRPQPSTVYAAVDTIRNFLLILTNKPDAVSRYVASNLVEAGMEDVLLLVIGSLGDATGFRYGLAQDLADGTPEAEPLSQERIDQMTKLLWSTMDVDDFLKKVSNV